LLTFSPSFAIRLLIQALLHDPPNKSWLYKGILCQIKMTAQQIAPLAQPQAGSFTARPEGRRIHQADLVLNKMGQIISGPAIPMEEPPPLKFTMFPKLPTELRNKIWEFALPGMCRSAAGKTQFLFRSSQNHLYGAIDNSAFIQVHEIS